MTDRFVVVPASYVFFLREGDVGTQVLLQLRQNTGYRDGYWAAVAGHVERGETAYDAARREAREEVGVEVGELTFLTTMHRTQRAAPIDERVDFFFSAREWTGELRIVEPVKCAELRWFPLADPPERVSPHEGVVLGVLRDGAVPAYVSYGF